MTASMIAAGLALLVVFWATGAYQRLSRQRRHCKSAFAQVDAQVRRRHELIPNLIDTARGYVQDERAALDAVLAADNETIAANAHAVRAAFDAPGMTRVAEAEATLEAALGAMFALAQGSADLADEHDMRRLIEELSDVENKIAFARQVYNEAAGQYNAARTQFPGSVIAFVFAFPPVASLPPAAGTQHP